MRTNFVGRSRVSAMTHTPASGPRAPVTVPPISFGPTLVRAPSIEMAASDGASAAAPAPTVNSAETASSCFVRIAPPSHQFGCVAPDPLRYGRRFQVLIEPADRAVDPIAHVDRVRHPMSLVG